MTKTFIPIQKNHIPAVHGRIQKLTLSCEAGIRQQPDDDTAVKKCNAMQSMACITTLLPPPSWEDLWHDTEG
jgi:hypothetical protein